MNTMFKQISKLLTFLLIISMGSCQKEELNDSITETKNTNLVKEFTFKQATQKTEFNNAYNKVSYGLRKINKNTRDSDSNFIIDSTTVKQITINGKTTYTMAIRRATPTPTYFENLIVQVSNIDSTRAFISKFTPNQKLVYHEAHHATSFHGTSEIKEIVYNSSMFHNKIVKICITGMYCNYGGSEHPAGENCIKTYPIENCVSIDVGGGSGGAIGSNPGGTGSTGGTGNSGSSGSTSNGNGDSGTVVTSTVIPTYNSINLTTALSLNTAQQNWIIAHPQTKKQLQQFLFADLFNDSNIAFATEAIKTLMNGGTINLENEIILDSTFENNQKAKCVFNKLLSSDLNTDTYFKNIIANLFDSNDKANIKFSIKNLPPGYLAITLPKAPFILTGNSMYDIILDATFVNNASNIEIAQTLIHELIHAELIQRLLDLGIITQVAYNASYDAIFMFTNGTQISSSTPLTLINALIQYYRNYNGANSQWNHNLMTALNYVNIISENLQQVYPLINDSNNDFLNNINNDSANTTGNFTLNQAINYLSWRGLESTQTYLTNIQNIPTELNKKNYIENASNTKFTKNCN